MGKEFIANAELLGRGQRARSDNGGTRGREGVLLHDGDGELLHLNRLQSSSKYGVPKRQDKTSSRQRDH